MKKKQKYIACSIITILLIAIIILLPKQDENEVYISKFNSENKSNNILSIMLETDIGSGKYASSKESQFPTTGYEFNAELSGCENGGKITYDDDTSLATVKTTISDKCYVYFYKIADVYVEVYTDGKKGVPKTYYSTNAEVACKNGTAEYNNKYDRLEVSSINTRIECRMDYTTVENATYLNDKVISLEDTTQGNGKVIFEKALDTAPAVSTWTALPRSQYGDPYSSTSETSTSGTSAPDAFSFNSSSWWSSNRSNMSSTLTYHFNFTVPTSGYYRICYELGKGSSEGALGYFSGSTMLAYDLVSNTETKNVCAEFGYFKAGTTRRIVLRGATDASYPTIPSMKFKIEQSNYSNYRYEGKDPNNYVWFNNELWRIIGVFGKESHGQNQKLVKIIRDDTIGGIVWDKNNRNNWATSSLKSLLNNYYYLAKDGTSSGYCYGNGATITVNCNYTGIGINSNYRPMVKNVTWYLGGHDKTADARNMYNYERGTTVQSGNATTTTGYIGLIYASDYMFSVLESDCKRTTVGSSYDSACASASWLYNGGYEWTITHSYYDSRWNLLYVILSTGDIESYDGGTSRFSPQYSYPVRPTLYLNESVYVLHGDGSATNPYIIRMD